jgi:antitoxin VapB
MALSIKDPDADRLARELAARTGETLTEAIVTSLRERLERERRKARRRGLADDLGEIGRRCASLPLLDKRTADEILGYDRDGLPR